MPRAIRSFSERLADDAKSQALDARTRRQILGTYIHDSLSVN
jgi:hypothetical protein